MRSKRNLLSLIILSFLGFLDASWLTYQHYFSNPDGTCGFGPFSGCGPVLTSKYSLIFGIPLAMLGLSYYIFTFSTLIISKNKKFEKIRMILTPTTFFAFIFSLYLMFLQIFILRSICIYCTGSAIISTTIFFVFWKNFCSERVSFFVYSAHFVYKYIIRKILFLTESDNIHEFALNLGQFLGKYKFINNLLSYFFSHSQGKTVNFKEIEFKNKIGLAAGFDYDAKLTQVMPSVGFGYMTVGTITNNAYSGNPKPLLGRLPKSKSLLVNKGFKNSGAVKLINQLEKLDFKIPVGVSIGRTNSRKLNTQRQSVEDIKKTFKLFENSKVKSSFYELNISCPNLYGNISFYPPKNLEELLVEIDTLKIKKPVFIKMPISISNQEFLNLLKVIDKHNVQGLIIGNLQTNRNHPQLVKSEVEKFGMGNFSGKPTFTRSNELIKLTKKTYKNRFFIIGCGGVFSSNDAKQKLQSGADMVQLVTGLIYEGPTLPQIINFELE